MQKVMLSALVLVILPLYAMDKEKEQKIVVAQSWVQVLHKKTDQAVNGNSVPLQLLLASKIDPNLMQHGCTPMKKVRETQAWYKQERMEEPAHLAETMALLKKHGGK